MKNNNKGLSYIELIIVIAVMSILTGVTALSMTYVSRTNASKTANQIVTILANSRTQCLAKGKENGKVVFRLDGNTYKYKIGDGSEETLATKPLNIVFESSSGVRKELSTGEMFEIKFEQSTGAPVATMGSETVCFIKVTKGESTSTVQLYELTGKSELVLD